MNNERLNKIKQTAYRTILILEAIERGERHALTIARRTKASRQLVEYYLKFLKGE